MMHRSAPRNRLRPGSHRVLRPWQRILVKLGVSLSSIFAFAASSGGGCLERTVSVPTGGSGGRGATSSVAVVGSQTGVSTSTGMPANPPTALALMTSELPPDSMACGFTTTCSPPPDMLFLEIASLGNTCQMPQGPMPTSGNFWNRQLGLPAKFQMVGTFPLNDPEVYWSGEEHMIGPDSAVGSTSGAPGAGWGMIQIISIDKTQITFQLSGLQNQDGQYTAKRCTPLP